MHHQLSFRWSREVFELFPWSNNILLDLVIPNQDELYHPSKSNFDAARLASVRLHRSLHKKGQFQSFQNEIEKGIGEKQLR